MISGTITRSPIATTSVRITSMHGLLEAHPLPYWDENGRRSEGARPLDTAHMLRLSGASDFTRPYNCFRGIIDEVVVYDRVLTIDEVKRLYQSGLNQESLQAVSKMEAKPVQPDKPVVGPSGLPLIDGKFAPPKESRLMKPNVIARLDPLQVRINGKPLVESSYKDRVVVRWRIEGYGDNPNVPLDAPSRRKYLRRTFASD